jgi:hypothetical protein
MLKGLFIFVVGTAVGAATTVALAVTGIIKAAHEGDVNVTFELEKNDALILADEAKAPTGAPISLSKNGATVTCGKAPSDACEVTWNVLDRGTAKF